MELLIQVYNINTAQLREPGSCKSARVRRDGSMFMVCAMNVKNIQEARFGFKKVKHMHADATHTVCTYRFPGLGVVHQQEYQDDWELSSIRFICSLIELCSTHHYRTA